MHEAAYKTDHPGILRPSQGILINTKPSTEYEKLRAKAILEQRQQERINNLETKMASIESMLEQIFKKVTDGKA